MFETSPLKLLFICRHNTVRSQIASALANKLGKGNVNASSAGPEPATVPEHIQQWINRLTGHAGVIESTALSDIEDQPFDLIITLCDTSHAVLPTLNSDVQHIRWDFQHAEDLASVKHLEMEIAERLRLMFLAKHII